MKRDAESVVSSRPWSLHISLRPFKDFKGQFDFMSSLLYQLTSEPNPMTTLEDSTLHSQWYPWRFREGQNTQAVTLWLQNCPATRKTKELKCRHGI
jgi:hypothetical protein